MGVPSLVLRQHLGQGWMVSAGKGLAGRGIECGEDREFGGCVRTKPGWRDSDKAETRGEGMGDSGGAGGTGTAAERTETEAGE